MTYTEFVRWIQKSTGCIDIICRYWAQPERAKEDVGYSQLAKLPSWIQQNPPFESKKNFERRINGDIFVGLPGRGSYDACHGFPARVRYGAYSDLSERSLPLPVEEVKVRSKMTPSQAWTPKRQRDRSESGTENHSVKVPRMAPYHAQPDPGRTTPTPVNTADSTNTETQQHDRPEVHVERSEQIPRIAASLMGRMSVNAEDTEGLHGGVARGGPGRGVADRSDRLGNRSNDKHSFTSIYLFLVHSGMMVCSKHQRDRSFPTVDNFEQHCTKIVDSLIDDNSDTNQDLPVHPASRRSLLVRPTRLTAGMRRLIVRTRLRARRNLVIVRRQTCTRGKSVTPWKTRQTIPFTNPMTTPVYHGRELLRTV